MVGSGSLIALVFAGFSAANKELSSQSGCQSKAGTSLDDPLTDETSFLQKANQFKHRRGIQVQRSSGVTKPNIVYIRLEKVGSTTSAGVVRRIAASHNLTGAFTRTWPAVGGEPGVWTDHGALSYSEYGPNPTFEPQISPVRIGPHLEYLPSWKLVQDLKKPVFLWTVIRDPAVRAMSKYYWDQSFDMSVGTKSEWLERFENPQFRYIRMSNRSSVNDVFQTYDLIGLTERLDESMVVLAAMLKVPLSDILYLSAKNSSAGFIGRRNLQHKPHPSLSEEPEEVQELINGPFRAANDLDYQLHQRAHETLTAKIAELNLESAIQKYKVLLAEAQESCYVPGTDKEAVENLVDCYFDDEGCNYKCLNTFTQKALEICEWCEDRM
mmetsp:Transcript_95075/g.167931  ORF Transcript_95075/g.167931 Transcript_95075/m.167931 type:complete len:382 (+) Transcript_95075:79-1224(+)